MKVLLLAAGYATRLYPLTLNQPKPLLDVAGRPVIEFILDTIEPIEEVDEVFIVTNHKFYTHFEKWKEKFSGSKKKITVIDDGTLSNDDRLGATGEVLLPVTCQIKGIRYYSFHSNLAKHAFLNNYLL